MRWDCWLLIVDCDGNRSTSSNNSSMQFYSTNLLSLLLLVTSSTQPGESDSVVSGSKMPSPLLLNASTWCALPRDQGSVAALCKKSVALHAFGVLLGLVQVLQDASFFVLWHLMSDVQCPRSCGFVVPP